MRDLKEILEETVSPINLSFSTEYKKFLTEADDFGGDDAGGDDAGDPFADVGGDDAAADDVGGGDAGDPFAADAGGGAGGGAGGAGGAGGDANAQGADGAEDADKKLSPVDDGSHEDDPDFTQGQADSDDVTLSKNPAGKMMYDTEKVMQTVMAVIQSLKDDQLVEIEKVKTAIELVFNGKKLNDEDLEFTNLKNAIFLIKKVGAKLDTKHRLYLYRKIKEPLIQKRDQIKQDIAVKKGQLQNAREVLTAMDVK